MPLYRSPKIPIVLVINAIDDLLVKMNIKPVLDYKNIQYNLADTSGQPLLSIRITDREIEYKHLCTPDKETIYDPLFAEIEKVIISLV